MPSRALWRAARLRDVNGYFARVLMRIESHTTNRIRFNGRRFFRP
jgi:hypothetical protein